MGSQSVKAIESLRERKEFLYHLLNDVKALEMMLDAEVFEKGIRRIGAEQELCLVDKNYRPSCNSLEILKKINDPHFTTELALFNMEINLDPLELSGQCFSKIEKELNELISVADKIASQVDNTKIILTGILPTLRKRDMIFKNITPYPRYKVLNKILKSIRGDDFLLRIKGVDELIINHKSILFEACNTSFQIHLQIPQDELVDKYNWAQTIAGPVLSITANSPLLLGRELWSETRIALFQQSVDLRNRSYLLREQKPRVSFGSNWIKDSVIELYQDDIVRYTPLLTTTKEMKEDAIAQLKNGKIPKLEAIHIHNGTIYRWNRLCYGETNGVPHMRIENRYIPSGPTVKDEVANALFWVGLMQGIPEKYKNLHDFLPFNEVKGNFINAARTGINTYFNWFGKGISARRLILTELIPIAREGLLKSKIDQKDIDYYLNIIQKRAETRYTGSQWIRHSNRILKKKMTKDIANATLTAHLYKNQKEGKPVHDWKLAKDNHVLDLDIGMTKLEKFMTTEVFVVNENDLVELVAKIMDWRNIHHIPVVNDNNRLTGLITKKNIQEIFGQDTNVIIAKDIMVKEVITVDSETSIEKANSIMIENNIGCLPIVELEDLVGILTKNDLNKILSS
ncbi:CBS domain-containing protein [Lutimonas zeaxanthinifaciens]|uniref:CBS domain-containing protein n=1 Tax=Lutimonas zeaxanthinifaciens TaxID=3060215 RepID=UPI00265CD422|nr:CBS domain-containing protein [Lutimonas sp. YSD2104]WKK64729.1 CBS domain-containing protein [Lutimonas sp. YSD2104]